MQSGRQWFPLTAFRKGRMRQRGSGSPVHVLSQEGISVRMCRFANASQLLFLTALGDSSTLSYLKCNVCGKSKTNKQKHKAKKQTTKPIETKNYPGMVYCDLEKVTVGINSWHLLFPNMQLSGSPPSYTEGLCRTISHQSFKEPLFQNKCMLICREIFSMGE